jgi:hypothetical protein
MIGTSLSQETEYIQGHTIMRHITDLMQHHRGHTIIIIMVVTYTIDLQDQIIMVAV